VGNGSLVVRVSTISSDSKDFASSAPTTATTNQTRIAFRLSLFRERGTAADVLSVDVFDEEIWLVNEPSRAPRIQPIILNIRLFLVAHKQCDYSERVRSRPERKDSFLRLVSCLRSEGLRRNWGVERLIHHRVSLSATIQMCWVLQW
jgi:hypothetical protein